MYKKINMVLGVLAAVVLWVSQVSIVSAQSCGTGGVCAVISECPSNNFANDAVCGSGMVCCLPTGGVGDPLPPTTPTCTGNCRPSCFSNENRDSTQSCQTSGTVCCKTAATGGPGDGGTGGGSQCTGNKIGGVCFPSGTGLSEKSIIEILTAFIGWILGIFGFIALLGFIISGLQYIFATGDEGMAETAKRNMKYSIIGVIVALSGWIVIKAVDALLNASPWI